MYSNTEKSSTHAESVPHSRMATPQPYILFIALALFLMEGPALKDMEFDEILMHMNSVSQRKPDVGQVLCLAEYRFWLFVSGQVPPERLETGSE